jgi:hypothetical protein
MFIAWMYCYNSAFFNKLCTLFTSLGVCDLSKGFFYFILVGDLQNEYEVLLYNG